LVLAASAVSLGTALAVIYAVPERRGILGWLHGRGAELAVRLARRHAVMVLVAWMVLLSACAWGVSRIRLDTDVTNWFPRGGEVRDSYEEIRARLAGISPINIMIEAPTGRSVAEPEVVARLASFTAFLEGLDDVDKATSIATPVRKLHEALSEDGRTAPLPSDAMLIHQYLLLLDSTEEVSELIVHDRTVANVAVRVSNNGSERLLEIARVARQWWDGNGIEEFVASPTGIMFEFARAEHSIALGQLGGLGLDLATLGLLYVLVFRGVILTLIALVPSVVTVMVAFGLLGSLGAPLDAGTVFVGMLAIGVTVDETIHLVTAFSQRLAGRGDAMGALEKALQSVFPALCVTTIALAGGFAVLGFSSFAFTQRLGALTAVAMIVCAAASSSLLPALLARYRGAAKG
jgi:predicted RND superfamily exporter protein